MEQCGADGNAAFLESLAGFGDRHVEHGAVVGRPAHASSVGSSIWSSRSGCWCSPGVASALRRDFEYWRTTGTAIRAATITTPTTMGTRTRNFGPPLSRLALAPGTPD